MNIFYIKHSPLSNLRLKKYVQAQAKRRILCHREILKEIILKPAVR